MRPEGSTSTATSVVSGSSTCASTLTAAPAAPSGALGGATGWRSCSTGASSRPRHTLATKWTRQPSARPSPCSWPSTTERRHTAGTCATTSSERVSRVLACRAAWLFTGWVSGAAGVWGRTGAQG
eukprot:scaffold68326_cov75-Phaeocystis_antarctica.AAC.1